MCRVCGIRIKCIFATFLLGSCPAVLCDIGVADPNATCAWLPLLFRLAPTEAVQRAGQSVTWVCDPMHGNTETVLGYKTRRYDNIRSEIEAFFDVHDKMGTVPGEWDDSTRGVFEGVQHTGVCAHHPA